MSNNSSEKENHTATDGNFCDHVKNNGETLQCPPESKRWCRVGSAGSIKTILDLFT